MTEIMHNLYHMVEDWVGRQTLRNEEAKQLADRHEALQDEIIRRLGEDGLDMMEDLSNLNLELESIHDEALFRAAMRLGAQIAAPRRGTWAAEWPQ